MPMIQPLGEVDVEKPGEDPVCHSAVDEKSRHSSLYRGVVVRFCSRQCKQEFDANPQLWLSVSHAVMVSSNHGVL
ncbi:MAG: YHS domain-containing protein [Capsulimonadaceae bacterium]|nr:YHS domain-containing protein [Capsulimonadaceae bacterium]